MSVNKILAEFMGWEYDTRWRMPCFIKAPSTMGRQQHFDPTTSRDDLQLVVEKLTPGQCDSYYEKKYHFAWAKIRGEGETGDILSKRMECIPIATLARLVSEVIEGSNSDGQ